MDANFHSRRILLIISGGIAAYKSLELIRRLREQSAKVRCLLTQGGAQFVRLLGPNGRVVAAINALPPDGASTLYLGDTHQEARIVLGALMPGDIPKVAPADDWGLQIRQPTSLEPLLTILAKTALGRGSGVKPKILQIRIDAFLGIQRLLNQSFQVVALFG